LNDGFDLLLLGHENDLLGRVEVVIDLRPNIIHPPGQALVDGRQVINQKTYQAGNDNRQYSKDQPAKSHSGIISP
jgi:hypothetical protein